MKTTYVLIMTMILTTSAAAQSAPDASEWVPIQTIIQNYSDRTGTKIVFDPRVNAKVRMIGIGLNDIDRPTLIKILWIHGFDMVETNSVTYVVTDTITDDFRERLAGKVE